MAILILSSPNVRKGFTINGYGGRTGPVLFIDPFPRLEMEKK